VVTQIDYDHQEWLGDTLEKIAREKAGILKPGIPAVFEAQPEEAARVLDTHQPAMRTTEWSIEYLVLQPHLTTFAARRGDRRLRIRCPLAGEHQMENALAAITALVELGVDSGTIENGIARTVWPGRLERFGEKPQFVLDGAHNPAGARALAAYIRRFYDGRPVTLVYGAMADKDVAQMSEPLFPLAGRIILTRPDNPRAMDPAKIAEESGCEDAEVIPAVPDALAAAREDADTTVFVTGSLYLVGQVRGLLTAKRG
jgi:dihydrofolate synthase/folylpolyglutamate synthase